MVVRRAETWIQIAELDEQDRIIFTPEFRRVMGLLGWEAKAFVGHLLGLWDDPFEHLLDYTSGDARQSADQPGKFSCNGLEEAQEVVEYWSERWAKNGKEHEPAHEAGTGLGLPVEWYRDVLRAKLVSLRLPERLLTAYRDAVLPLMEEGESS